MNHSRPVRIVAVVFGACAGACIAIGAPPSAQAKNASLTITAPPTAAVGQAIPLTFTLAGGNVAGFEGLIRFDESAAEFGGLFPGGEDSPLSGVQSVLADG